jgi:hypothetical protein
VPEWTEPQLNERSHEKPATSATLQDQTIEKPRIVQGLQKQVRERDRQLADLRAQLEPLRAIDQEHAEKQRKVKTPASRMGRKMLLKYMSLLEARRLTMSLESEQEKSVTGNYLQPRYRQRIRLRFPVTFIWESRVGKGEVLDLTNPGCLIQSPVAVEDDQSLQLELFLPGLESPLSVMLGVVRWTKGKRFGVEFIKMHDSQQRIWQAFLAKQSSDLSTRT